MLTVGSVAHVQALAGWRGRVLVKLASSVRRFGTDRASSVRVTAAVRGRRARRRRVQHPPTGRRDRRRAPRRHLRLARRCSIPTTRCGSATSRPRRTRTCATPGPSIGSGSASAPRCGTATRRRCTSTPTCSTSDPVRGRRTMPATARASCPSTATSSMVGAGTAHGVHPLDDGRSPFHFARRRLRLLEPPHMHTSMVLVPDGDPCRRSGDHVDVQRPLITSFPDEVALAMSTSTRRRRRRSCARRAAARTGRRARRGPDRRGRHELPRLPHRSGAGRPVTAPSPASSIRGTVRCRRGSRRRSCSSPVSA